MHLTFPPRPELRWRRDSEPTSSDVLNLVQRNLVPEFFADLVRHRLLLRPTGLVQQAGAQLDAACQTDKRISPVSQVWILDRLLRQLARTKQQRGTKLLDTDKLLVHSHRQCTP